MCANHRKHTPSIISTSTQPQTVGDKSSHRPAPRQVNKYIGTIDMSTSTNSGSDSAHTPPSSPPPTDNQQQRQSEPQEIHQSASAIPCADDKITDGDEDNIPYLHLPEEYTQDLTWSNHPGDLALQTYFNPNKPHLGGDFGVEGLQPVLREKRGPHRFILVDSKDRFYMYEEWDGFLYWVKSKELEELVTYQEKVNWILCELGDLETEPVFQDRHPADFVASEGNKAIST